MGGLRNQLKSNKGFTLIEIIIVMAIAGLIFVIVFLGVQGAQRSRRDTAHKAAAARLLAAAEQVASNGTGVEPATCAAIGTAYNDGGGANPCVNRGTALTTSNVEYSGPGWVCNGTVFSNSAALGASNQRSAVRIQLETGNLVWCQNN